jgi:hypothetical protein
VFWQLILIADGWSLVRELGPECRWPGQEEWNCRGLLEEGWRMTVASTAVLLQLAPVVWEEVDVAASREASRWGCSSRTQCGEGFRRAPRGFRDEAT